MTVAFITTAPNIYAPCRNRPDSKIHGANMGPIWGRQDPGAPHVGPMNFAIWAVTQVRNMPSANSVLPRVDDRMID